MAVKTKRRVALLTNYPADHTTFSGGVETATAALLEGLRAYQSEFDFHVISVSNVIAHDLMDKHDGFCFHFLSIPRQPWLRPRFPVRVVKAYKLLRRLKPDLIHCQDNMALALAAIFSGYPSVFTIHGVKRHEAPKRTGWEFWSASLDALIERYAHKHFDAFICISNYAAHVVGDAKPTFAIPNAVSSRYFQAPTYAPLISPRLLFVGVLAPLKRPLDLLAAHATLRGQFPNLEAVFCGAVEDAGYVHNMQQVIRESGIEGVHFEGRVNQARLAELLGGTFALVLPSAQENAPMVVAEAMAAGVPVVATRVGGIPDMVKHGETGLLYESGNGAELTECIRRLLVDSGLRERMGQQAKKHARATYSPAHVARATIAAYEQMLQPAMPTVVEQNYV